MSLTSKIVIGVLLVLAAFTLLSLPGSPAWRVVAGILVATAVLIGYRSHRVETL